jgi:predicted membrane chloride channel (bestrophin family)
MVQKQHLQGVVIDEELDPLLPTERITEIQSKRNRPLFIIRELEQLIHMAMKEKYQSTSEDSTTPKYIEKHFIESINMLSAALASCERILKQPVPLSYSRHTSRFLSLYILLLPFSLVGSMGFATIPAVTLIHWALISVQEIAHFIEEPFDLKTQIIPLNQIASVIRADCSEILDNCLESDDLDRVDALLRKETMSNWRLSNDLNDYSKYNFY